MQNWFPLGLAKGKAFCNRQKERKHLKHNINYATHTLIISPRRYGKTSLAQKVIAELKLPASLFEFTLVSDHYTAQNIINTGIGQLLINLMPTHKKALMLASKYFAKLHPRLIIDTQLGPRIELKPEFQTAQSTITELLTSIDQAAREANKRVVLFMDEFQQIATLAEHAVIEAAIRNAAQRLEYTSLIFSGSNRHLLQLMFDDRARPLYHLCDRINLGRIQEDDYMDYIQKAAVEQWRMPVKPDLVNQILLYTQCHPYYVNVLCSRLWRDEHLPTTKSITMAWDTYLEEERFRIANELSQLSHHQKLMLMLLATKPFTQPTSKEVIAHMRASVGSVAKTCKILIQQDYIYQDSEGCYRILDPAIESYLKHEAGLVLGLNG